MNKYNVGIVVKKSKSRILVTFPWVRVVRKFSKIQNRLKMKWIKETRSEIRKGDVVFVDDRYNKLVFLGERDE